MDKQLLYKIGLTKISKVGPVIAKNLISYCGGVEAVFQATKKELLAVPGVGQSIASKILRQDVLHVAENEIEFIKKNNIQPLFYLDKNYPRRLKNYPDCPVLLYYDGKANLNSNRIVSIVGTRKPSTYGKSICEEIVKGLAPYNVTIVSGLAFGIDITAHRKCLDEKISTIGVLGHGLGQIYPFEHRKTANEMKENGGLLTEFTSDLEPNREHFPMRNRIIAGMCDALIVVESASKGGSIISAQIANNYFKDVFAVPGRTIDKKSQGCNNLIRTNKAALLEKADHLASFMGWDIEGKQNNIQKQLFLDLTKMEQTVVDVLDHVEPKDIDKLTFELKLSSSEMAALLLNLEFKGVIKNLPGKRFVLIH